MNGPRCAKRLDGGVGRLIRPAEKASAAAAAAAAAAGAPPGADVAVRAEQPE